MIKGTNFGMGAFFKGSIIVAVLSLICLFFQEPGSITFYVCCITLGACAIVLVGSILAMVFKKER